MHILFDADGTFLNSSYLDNTLVGVQKDVLTDFFINKFPPTVIGEADLKELLSEELPNIGYEDSVDEFMNIRFTSQTDVREGMLELVKACKNAGHKCSLCTQQEQYRSVFMKENMGFSEIFDATYFTCDFGYSKKDTRFFTSVVDVSGFDPDETYIIDDSAQYCEVATQAGLTAIHFTGVASLQEDLAALKLLWQ